MPDLRLRALEDWPRSERMAQEREVFGFYFSAHPVEAFRSVASAQGARSYQSLMTSGAPAGGRANAAIAALVENVRIGQTRKGKDFIRADFSDSTGQFSAACFEDSMVEDFRRWAAEGECVLLQVELDSPSPDEPPRVTVRGARPLKDVSGEVRMLLALDLADEAALSALAEAVPRGGTGEVRVRLTLDNSERVALRLGRDFVIDGSTADRLESLPGIANVQLVPLSGKARLRLVA